MKAGLAAVLIVVGAPAAAQKAPDCGRYPVEEAQVACLCGPGPHSGAVWGANPYTADSDICTAAVHAGVLGPSGGPVLARLAEGQESYVGTTSNGITTSGWGSYPQSFTFANATASVGTVACRRLAEGEASLTCACPADGVQGAVWGSGPYTADSDACTAARHAGVIGAEGGTVTLLAAPGVDAYLASEANGVATMAYGPYGASMDFAR